jgi:pyruvate-formate lyase
VHHPGREYTLNDVVKINFAAVFETALKEMMADPSVQPSTADLWDRFVKHLRRGVSTVAQGTEYHLAHMWEVFPELVLDLLSHGPIEKGLDASHGGLEFYNMCIDGTALATVADSFAALEQRVELEGKLTWPQLMRHLEEDYAGAEDVRQMLKSIPRYGVGGSRADEYAVRVAKTFPELVKAEEKLHSFKMIPGLFSWAHTIPLGKRVGATPNGRHAYTPISHGANPDPGFTGAGAPTAMAVAIAAVQPGYGNTAPLQLDLDPGLARDEDGILAVEGLIKGHVALGGTQMNINILNREQVLEAHADPTKYPDLVVRVTGFSAYFASLSPDFRKLVVDRLIVGM